VNIKQEDLAKFGYRPESNLKRESFHIFGYLLEVGIL
jgi:hypothetical protein